MQQYVVLEFKLQRATTLPLEPGGRPPALLRLANVCDTRSHFAAYQVTQMGSVVELHAPPACQRSEPLTGWVRAGIAVVALILP
jgi:hypothetical protein